MKKSKQQQGRKLGTEEYYGSIVKDKSYLSKMLDKVERDPLFGEQDRWETHKELQQLKRRVSYPNGVAPEAVVKAAHSIIKARRKAGEEEALAQDPFINKNIFQDSGLSRERKLEMARKANKDRQRQEYMGFAGNYIDNKIYDSIISNKQAGVLGGVKGFGGRHIGENETNYSQAGGVERNALAPHDELSGITWGTVGGTFGKGHKTLSSMPPSLSRRPYNESRSGVADRGQALLIGSGRFFNEGSLPGNAQEVEEALSFPASPARQDNPALTNPREAWTVFEDFQGLAWQEEAERIILLEYVKRNPEQITPDLMEDVNTYGLGVLMLNEARRNLGSGAWAYLAERRNVPSHKYKCNLFLWEMMVQAGLPAPTTGGDFGGNPTSARQWGDPSENVPCWMVVDEPQPGDIVTNGFHVGIYSGNGMAIGASSSDNIVNEKSLGRWSHQSAIIFRRFDPNCILLRQRNVMSRF